MRRPADKAREGGIPSVFRPKRNTERSKAEWFSRDASPAERRVGFATGCYPSDPHRQPASGYHLGSRLSAPSAGSHGERTNEPPRQDLETDSLRKKPGRRVPSPTRRSSSTAGRSSEGPRQRRGGRSLRRRLRHQRRRRGDAGRSRTRGPTCSRRRGTSRSRFRTSIERKELTAREVAGSHNNFYEFLAGRGGAVWKLAGDYTAASLGRRSDRRVQQSRVPSISTTCSPSTTKNGSTTSAAWSAGR